MGMADETRRILLILGTDQLGVPSQEVRAELNSIVDVKRLEDLALRLKHASTWEDLLGLPGIEGSRRKASS